MNDKKQKTIETYNRSAHAMKQKFSDIGARVHDISQAFSFCKIKNPHVLEIGCGYGREASVIIRHTDSFVGIDISKEFIELAKKEVPSANFEVADIEEYEFPKHLDIIFAFASLLHSSREHVEIILNKAYDALNSGGIIYISLKYGDYREVMKKDEFGERVFYLYTPDDIKMMAGQKLDTIYEDSQELRGQKWFTIVLRKKRSI